MTVYFSLALTIITNDIAGKSTKN